MVCFTDFLETDESQVARQRPVLTLSCLIVSLSDEPESEVKQ